MIIFISILLFVVGAKTTNTGEFFEDSFNVKQTNALKGLCAIYVIFHHLCTYMAGVYPSFLFFEKAGFLMVGMFFFISGYGLMYGVLNKTDYLKGFFTKRILSILVPYYIINIFYIISKYIVGVLDTKYIVLSIFGYHLWYVMAILILYAGFWFCFKVFGNQKGVAAITAYTLIYIIVMYILYKHFGKTELGFWWYNSVLCFPLGIWYCKYKETVNIFFKKHYLFSFITVTIIFAAAMYYTAAEYNESTPYLLLAEIVCSVFFAIWVVIISMKMQFGNKPVNLCGKMSLELYLSHALFIFFLRSNITIFGYTVYISNNMLYLVSILTGSFVFSFTVNKISAILTKPFKKVKSSSNKPQYVHS